jgi:NAD(P)-dependent dehydrogenase (short-subunit alcohol dehydrogenase family)
MIVTGPPKSHISVNTISFETDKLAVGTPLRRLGDQDDLKGAAVLFASDAGKHLTGQILAIDGGLTAVMASGHRGPSWTAALDGEKT